MNAELDGFGLESQPELDGKFREIFEAFGVGDMFWTPRFTISQSRICEMWGITDAEFKEIESRNMLPRPYDKEMRYWRLKDILEINEIVGGKKKLREIISKFDSSKFDANSE